MKSIRRWRLKGKLKVILILLFFVSILFISYQLLYYTSITQYHQGDSHHNKVIQSERTNKESYNHNSKTNDRDLNKPVAQKSVSSTKNPNINIHHHRGKPVFSGLEVAPEYWYLYSRQQQRSNNYFTCFTTDRKIPWSHVNDDYCDCVQDGSDEPSTSACMNGKFYCTNQAKNYPDYIPSSFVNDGIKDCVDGSDEYEFVAPSLS